MNAICIALELFCLFPAKILVRLLVFLEWKLTATNQQQSTSSVYLFQNRSEYWTFPVEVVTLWVNRKPNQEFDLQMTGSQEVLFWYERTIISLQFFINLVRRKYFRIQASMNTGSEQTIPPFLQNNRLLPVTCKLITLFYVTNTCILIKINDENTPRHHSRNKE